MRGKRRRGGSGWTWCRSGAAFATLDIGDPLDLPGPVRRQGTTTALARSAEGILALSSGHVAMPFDASGESVLHELPEGGAPSGVEVEDAASGERFAGTLISGGIDSEADWAVTRFDDAEFNVDLTHPCIGRKPPFEVRSSEVEAQLPVFHFAADRGILAGRIAADRSDDVMLRLPDGSRLRYRDVWIVSHVGRAFSVGGDSGSLVVDGDRRVVGAVLGGSSESGESYVLPAPRLVKALAERSGVFFR